MDNLNNFEYLVGDKNISKKPTQPYNDIVCNFLGDLSDELNRTTPSKNYADIKTLAFWCRKKNIYNLKKKFISDEVRIGLGLIFHITPSNIPTNFAYSLIFGLITGNSNTITGSNRIFTYGQNNVANNLTINSLLLASRGIYQGINYVKNTNDPDIENIKKQYKGNEI